MKKKKTLEHWPHGGASLPGGRAEYPCQGSSITTGPALQPQQHYDGTHTTQLPQVPPLPGPQVTVVDHLTCALFIPMASLCHRDSPGPYRPLSGCPSDQMNSSALSSPGSLRLLPESLQGGHIMNLLWNHLVVPASNVLPLWPLSWSPQGPPLTAEVLPPQPYSMAQQSEGRGPEWLPGGVPGRCGGGQRPLGEGAVRKAGLCFPTEKRLRDIDGSGAAPQ